MDAAAIALARELCDYDDILAATRPLLTTLTTPCRVFRCRLDRAKGVRGGYGLLEVGGGEGRRASTWRFHLLVWTIMVGPLEEGMEVDHLCRNRACGEITHLEAVDHATNVARQDDDVWKAAVTSAGLEVLLEQPEEMSLFGLSEVPRADAYTRYASY